MSRSFVSIESGTINDLIARARNGDTVATEELFRQIYDELRDVARQELRKEQKRDLLQTTALVNEVCLKLADDGFRLSVTDRRHLFGCAIRAMRQILVDYARQRNAEKRGGGVEGSPLEAALANVEHHSQSPFIDLHDALEELESSFPRAASVVDLRFFSGLSIEQTAELLEVSVDTVKRDWRFGRAFLFERLKSDN